MSKIFTLCNVSSCCFISAFYSAIASPDLQHRYSQIYTYLYNHRWMIQCFSFSASFVSFCFPLLFPLVFAGTWLTIWILIHFKTFLRILNSMCHLCPLSLLTSILLLLLTRHRNTSFILSSDPFTLQPPIIEWIIRLSNAGTISPIFTAALNLDPIVCGWLRHLQPTFFF